MRLEIPAVLLTYPSGSKRPRAQPGRFPTDRYSDTANSRNA